MNYMRNKWDKSRSNKVVAGVWVSLSPNKTIWWIRWELIHWIYNYIVSWVSTEETMEKAKVNEKSLLRDWTNI
jgi:hypothetical protein